MAVHVSPSKSKQASTQFLDGPRRREAAGGHLLNFDLNQSAAPAGFL
jgi:hypothetical protein